MKYHQHEFDEFQRQKQFLETYSTDENLDKLYFQELVLENLTQEEKVYYMQLLLEPRPKTMKEMNSRDKLNDFITPPNGFIGTIKKWTSKLK
jgi:hypothetical protein